MKPHTSPSQVSFRLSGGSILEKTHHITGILTLHCIFRYNNFPKDPLAKCDCKPPYSGENGISARSDLNPPNMTFPFGALGPRLHGGIDMKVNFSHLHFCLEL